MARLEIEPKANASTVAGRGGGSMAAGEASVWLCRDCRGGLG